MARQRSRYLPADCLWFQASNRQALLQTQCLVQLVLGKFALLHQVFSQPDARRLKAERLLQVDFRHIAGSDQNLAELALMRQQCIPGRVGMLGLQPDQRFVAHASAQIAAYRLQRCDGVDPIRA